MQVSILVSIEVQVAREENNTSKTVPEWAQSATPHSQYCCRGAATLRRPPLPMSDWQRRWLHCSPSAPLGAGQHLETSTNLKALPTSPSTPPEHL